MKRKDLIKIIDEAIDTILEEIDNKEIETAEHALFYGLEKNINSKPFRMAQITKNKLNEGSIIPSVTKTDVNKFESDFRASVVGATVVFDKQSNGYSLNFPKRQDGIEVFASGTIELGRNQKLKFKFSLIDGLMIDTVNFLINDDSKDVFENLFSYFQVWEKTWRENII